MQDDAEPAAKRPASGMRGRAATRRGATAAASSAAPVGDDAANGADDAMDEGEPASWKVELESIMAGTHPTLVEALEPHDQKMKTLVGQAEKVRQLQMVNINALFDCEKKQADDENKVRFERARTAVAPAHHGEPKKTPTGNRQNAADC